MVGFADRRGGHDDGMWFGLGLVTGSTPALSVATDAIDDPGPLVSLLAGENPLIFVRRGDGLVGFGEALRLEFSGPGRFSDAAAAWRAVAGAASVSDAVNRPGSGLVAVGSFAFSDSSAASSVLIVPSILIGRGDGFAWITRIGQDPLANPTPFHPPSPIALAPGRMSEQQFAAAVQSALDRIHDGGLSKVVIARDLIGKLPAESDLRPVIERMATAYDDTFTFAVDGLIGSSPETLVQVSRGFASARVLAGSSARGSTPADDAAAAAALAASEKDLDEHEFAVRSVVDALAPHSNDLATSEQPFPIGLPNLWHLASEVTGSLSDGSSALDLVAALHPTAAVAGAPTAAAMQLIAELEPFDRGRYAGPVGWVDSNGDGEWAIALRCAQVDDDGLVTAYAGAGIVDGSTPADELAETVLKFRPVVEAFG